jgi:hypothetical protein
MEHGRECYHCKQWIGGGERHDCWSTTEAALTRDLHDDLQDAYERLREVVVEFGQQRIYASHHSIMFSRRACYCFVRPKRAWLEVCVFLGREVKAPSVRKVTRASRHKVAHLFRVTHRDEIEAPLTAWLSEAYDFAGPDASARHPSLADADPGASARRPSPRKRAAKKR